MMYVERAIGIATVVAAAILYLTFMEGHLKIYEIGTKVMIILD